MSQEGMMESQKYLRIIEKRGKAFVVDMNGDPLQPSEAQKLGNSLVETANSKSFVYIGKRAPDGAYKIGRTEDIGRRKRELGIEFDYVFECELYGDKSSVKLEAAFHDFFKENRLDGEWFKLSNADLRCIRRFQRESDPIAFITQLDIECWKILDDLEKVSERQHWLMQSGLLITGHIPMRTAAGWAIYYLLWSRYEQLVDLKDDAGANYILGIASLVETLFTVDFNQIKKDS